MPLGVLIFLYILVFCSLYTQVFFLVTFWEKRKVVKAHEERVAASLPDITILVPCWNEGHHVGETIDSLFALDYPREKIHVVAVDDGSTDDTWKQLQKFENQDNVIVLTKENGGKHTAINFGLPHVSTDWMCVIDADTVLTKSALKEVVSYIDEDHNLAAVAGAILIENPKTIYQKAQNIEYQMFSFTKKVLGLLKGVLVAPGAFSLFRTDIVRKVGAYKQAYNMEDLELTYRLQRQGYRVEHSHTAIAYTKGPDTLKRLFQQRLRWSYGFINNTKDYKDVIFNYKFGDFGMFTLPMSLFAYLLVVTMFFVSWYYIVEFMIDSWTLIRINGIDGVLNNVLSFDWFYVSTDAFAFLAILLYVSVFLVIILGRRTSRLKVYRNLTHLAWFFILYTFLAPFWILTSVVNVIRSYQPNWR
jgi:cellulose synthase/poly-beta-1,6-N-acetylglucosamine synthase-like glycosyltransferase